MAVVGKPSKIGKYDVVEILGEGGMGAVYKAVDPRIGRTVAIKVIKGDFAQEPELRRRFDTEARAVGNLQHPNIVTVFDFGEENGSPYLVMQYLDGTPLDKVIAQRLNLPFIQKLDIIIGVLKALDYAHEHGVIHRDVKPANVHLLKDGSVKLLDFGIAREGGLSQTKTGQIMGTMFYMPPEQMNGEVVDRRGDIFSTAIMLFELLTYSLPFEARDQTAIIIQRLKGDPPPPLSKYFENYPLELDEIIARAMMRDREERYSRAEDFAFDLMRVQERLKRDMASHYVDQARALIAKSDLAKAREILSQVLKIDTQNSTAKQLFYEVQQSLQKAQKVERVQQLRVQAKDALSAKHLDQAAELVDQAIRMDQSDPDLMELRELVQEAKARAQQVKKLLNLATVAQQSEQFEVAQKAVTDALALDPADTDAKLMQATISRQLVEHEKQHRVQQLLQAARREVSARQYEAARDNISKAKAIDPTHPEIPGLEKMVGAGLDQEKRRVELQQVCSEIERRLVDNNLTAARDLAASALRRFPGEERLIRLRAAADEAYEQQERRRYIDQTIASASRLVDDGQASSALKLLQDADRLYPKEPRLLEYIKIVREAADREAAEHEKKGLLLLARAAVRRKSFAEAIEALERGLVQFPADAEIRELLEATRQESERFNQKKRVEEVSREAERLLQTGAHTDAIGLLERSVVQVPDPDLARLLDYARQEAAKYRADVQRANEQATQLLNEGRHSEALQFLETQSPAFGKNAGFQVLLDEARRQAEEAAQTKRRVVSQVEEAHALIRSGDLYGAEAVLRTCQAEAPSESDVLALAIRIDEEKKALERKQQDEAKRSREPQPREATATSKPTAKSGDETKIYRIEPEPHNGPSSAFEVGAPSPLPPQMGPQPPAPTAWFPVAEPQSDVRPPQIEHTSPAEPETVPEPPKTKKKKDKRTLAGVDTAGSSVEIPPAPAVRFPAPSEPASEAQVSPPAEPGKNKKLIVIAATAVALIAAVIAGIILIPHGGPPSIASLQLVDAPAGATLTVDDKPVSAGADGLYKVAPGSHSIRVSEQGYEDFSTSITADAGKTTPVKVAMRMVSLPPKQPEEPPKAKEKEVELGKLTIEGDTDSVEVYVDDSYQGRTGRDKKKQVSLPVGHHRLRFKKTGFKDQDKTVEVVANKENALKVEMVKVEGVQPPPPPMDADLTIHVKPGASVRVDGIPVTGVGDGSFTRKVPPGNHTLQVSLNGYEDYSEMVSVRAGESISRTPQMTAKPKPAPVVTFFEAEPRTITEGESANLRWETQNATEVSIEGVGAGGPSGTKTVSPTKPTVYKLTARGEGGIKTLETTVNVNPKPVIAPKPSDHPDTTKEAAKETPKATGSPGLSADDIHAINDTIEQYERFFNIGDIESIKALWPGIPDNFSKALKSIFNSAARVNLRIKTNGDPKAVSADTADLSCKEETTSRGNNGVSGPVRSVQVTYRFKKTKAGTWVIEGRN